MIHLEAIAGTANMAPSFAVSISLKLRYISTASSDCSLNTTARFSPFTGTITTLSRAM